MKPSLPFARHARVRHLFVAVAALLAAVVVATVLPDRDDNAATAGWEQRLQRRAFPGAPPVVPHAPQSGKCIRCHTETGAERPPLGLAPANPHLRTDGMSEVSNCRQCHVFQRSRNEFAKSEFQPLTPALHGSRAYPHAPPTIPHGLSMREDCRACHAGDAARPEIRCSHPSRLRCVQCHVYESQHEESWPKK